MTAFAGLRGTGDFATDERPKSFRQSILFLAPNGQAPLFALTSMMADEKVEDPEFSWFEEEQAVARCATNGNLNTVSTAVVLQASTYTGVHGTGLSYVPGDLLLVEKALTTGAYSNEIVMVTAVTDATNITISRGAAGTTAANIASGSYLTRIGNAFAEGTTSPNVSLRNPVKKYSYCQIFKTAFEGTLTTAAITNLRTGKAYENDKKRKFFDHAAAIEMAMLFGRRYEGVGSNNKPIRFAGGLLDPNIGLSTLVFATTPTENDLMDSLEPLFRQNTANVPNQRIAFCGNGFLNALNKSIKSESSTQFQYQGVLNIRGMELQKFRIPQGEIALKSHPLLSNHTLYTNSMLVLAPPLIRTRVLRDTDFKDDIQANDSDTRKGQWLSELGWEFHHASNNDEAFSHYHAVINRGSSDPLFPE